MKKRHRNHGVRKLCEHPRSRWADCSHPWHSNFKWKGKHYRFSLDKYLGRHVDSKSEAEDEAAKIRIAVKAGTFGQPEPLRETLTVGDFLDSYKERYVDLNRPASATDVGYQIGSIKAVVVERPDKRRKTFGEWLINDVTTDTIDRVIEARRLRGPVAGNRTTALLRAAFNWGIRKKLVEETPFKIGTETVVKLSKERARTRRVDGDEQTALLAACGPHLRALVEAAIETGCRKGELLSLQWSQVDGMQIERRKVIWAPKSELVLPFEKTKTREDRKIPISTRLRAILEMRRFDPAGNPHARDAFVFGTEIGTRLLRVSRAWYGAVLKAHGHKPVYTETANLTAECRAALKSINLHFHDLRREAGSRWMDGGVPIATIQRWLGHSNVSQTSTYLAGSQASEHDAMARFEAQQAALQRIATEVGKRGTTKTRMTSRRLRKLNRTAVDSSPAIM